MDRLDPIDKSDGSDEYPEHAQHGGWRRYEKTTPTWAIKLPRAVTLPTREGTVEAGPGDYLCIDADGGLYPCDEETFESMYEPFYGEDDDDE